MEDSMVVWLASALAGGVDRVPEDFPTIQDAVDHGRAEVIRLAPGRWSGAVVDRTVRLEGRHGAIIDAGVSVGPLQVGLWLVEGADGSVIDNVAFDCDAQLDGAVYASETRGGLPTGVSLRNLTARACVQAVSVVGPRGERVAGGWEVVGAVVSGTRTDALRGARGGGVGVLAYNVDDVEIVESSFLGFSDDATDFVSAGIVLAGCRECSVVGNRFATVGWQWGRASIVDAGASLPGGLVSEGLILADNDTSDAAWRGVGVRLHGSRDVLLDGNTGTVWRGR